METPPATKEGRQVATGASTTISHVVRQNQLPQTWNDFKRALRSPEPFNPFAWLYRLIVAAASDLYHKTGCASFVHRYRLNIIWKPLVPIFAMALVVLVVFSYFASIRSLIQLRWCCQKEAEATCEYCNWMLLHDFLVIYLSFMILFHYTKTVFQSPGVALPHPAPEKWTAMQSQGGLLGWDAVLDEAAERKRVATYGDLNSPDAYSQSTNGSNTQISYLPSPDPSYCNKCRIIRPPRCHHCSSCQRCILEFDHHCIWMNQCCGLHNYRHFLLTLFFLMLTCWYGVAMLFWAFYEPLREQVQIHGWKWMYSHGTGFLDLPPPMKLLRMMFTTGLPVKMVIDIVYPLVLGVGAVIGSFLGIHLKQLSQAKTSLEYRMTLDQMQVSLFRKSKKPPPVNPFDQGWYKNLKQTLGPNLILIFLPISVRPPPPYLPNGSKER